MTDKNKVDSAIEIAHFKFSLIAPAIQGTFTDASKNAYYKRVTENPIKRPDGTMFQYNHKTLAFWEQSYKKGGMDALMPGARSDKGVSRNLPDTAIAEIYNLKDKFPRLNATQIYLYLLREGFITKSTSLRCVQRHIKSCGLKTGSTALQKDRKAFEETYFGAMFQADTSYFPHIKEDGKSRRTYLMMIIDDYSRLIVGAGLFYSDTAENFQALLKSAVSTYGICEKLYTDNGAAYSNTQLKLITGSIGTVLLHAPVRDGAAKAKVERAFRSVKERWLYGLDVKQITSLAEFNELLKEHIREYNLMFHSGIGCSPMDRFLAGNEKVKKPVSQEWLDNCFMNRVGRRVKRDATFTIDKISFDAPMQFIGQTVEVRFIPGDMQTVYIFHGDDIFPVRMTNKSENSKTKRVKLPDIDYGKTMEVAHV